jgi:sugar phosphate isomerase/epimerase
MSDLTSFYVSSSAFPCFSDAVAYCKKHSLNLEISFFARGYEYDMTSQQEFEDCKKMFDAVPEMQKILHGICFDIVPTSLDPQVIELTRQRMKQSIELARYFNAHTVIFHSGYNSNVKYESYKNQFIINQSEYWKSFLDDNNITDLTVALENTYEETPRILKEICDMVNSPYFKTCIDTGHVNAFTNYNLIHWISELKNHLHHFHIHNNTSNTDFHDSLINGSIDYIDFFDYVLTLDVPLSYTLEMFDEQYVTDSLLFINNNYSGVL